MNTQEIAQQNKVYEVVAGSHSYGTNLPTSDYDTRGVFIAPPEIAFSLFKKIEQVEQKEPDTTIFEIRKFFALAANCNPNIIELLYTDPKDILHIDPCFHEVLDHRHLFLSKKAKHTFSGYAFAQMKRIKGHEKWISNPQPEKRPSLAQFCTIIDQNGKVIRPTDDEMAWYNANCFLVRTKGEYCFRMFTGNGFQRGIVADDGTQFRYFDVEESKVQERLTKQDASFFGTLLGDTEAFRAAVTNWSDYWTWKRNRNPQRAVLEEKSKYDCYSADTEFLTEDGWKLFDDITESTQLATLNQLNHRLQYQSYLEKHDAIYCGNMYLIAGHHTDIRVSGNHRMYIRECSRNLRINKQWGFSKVCNLPDTFDIISRINPKPRNFSNDKPCGLTLQHYLRLMGWYVSEGSIARKLKDGSPSALSLSQLKGGRLHWHISRARSIFAKQGVVILEYSYYRESKDRTEMTWTISHREIAKRLVAECGNESINKHLPRWVMHLSSRMQRILLAAMWLGDGTNRKLNGNSKSEKHLKRRVYYTASPQLADDFHELAFLAGFETSKWGPYDGMYQIHFSESASQYRRLMRFQNIQKEAVRNERIVCFTVPNEILITRRNGKIAIQGNTKHAMHLVRLMTMAKEIMTTGQVIVKRPDAAELLAIRNGAKSYEEILTWAEETDKELDALYEKSTLQNSPDYDGIDALLRRVLEKYWKSNEL